MVPDAWLPHVYGVLELADDQKFYNGQLVNAAAAGYICHLDPPFFQALMDYTDYGNAAFDCPGHQGGQFFENTHRADAFICILVRRYFVPIRAMPMCAWVIC